MDANTKAVFDALENQMVQKALERAELRGRAYAGLLQTFLTKYFKEFFQELADMVAAGLQTQPKWVSGRWDDLNPEYENYFKRRIDFANLDGDSHKALRELDASRVFGMPLVTGAIAAGGQEIAFTVDSRGRTRYAAGTLGVGKTKRGKQRKIGGKFASFDNLGNLKVSIRFTKPDNYFGARLDHGWFDSLIGRDTEEGADLVSKLGLFELGTKMRKRGGKQPARPLVAPYMEWKLGAKFDAELDNWFQQVSKR